MLRGRVHRDVAELRAVVAPFVASYNDRWLIEKNGHRSPSEMLALHQERMAAQRFWLSTEPGAVHLAASPLTSCGPSDPGCGDAYWYGLSVTVIDATTGQQICDATVTATDGAHSAPFYRRSFGSSCNYVGAPERPGTFTVTAERAGYAKASQGGVSVDFSPDGCRLSSDPVTLVLSRLSHGSLRLACSWARTVGSGKGRTERSAVDRVSGGYRDQGPRARPAGRAH